MAVLQTQMFILPTGKPCTIRSAVPTDAAEIIAHTRRVASETDFLVTTVEEVTFTEEQERAWIKQHTDNSCSMLLAAEIDNHIVGILSYRGETRKRLAHQGTFGISVRKEWHNHGIGRKLIETMLNWAKCNPTIERVNLEVFSSNLGAIHLYRALGFQEEGRRIHYVKLNNENYVDEVLMSRFVK